MNAVLEATRPEGPPRRAAGRQRWVALAVLCLSLLMVSLDNTILNVALPTLVRDLKATSSQLQLVVDAYAVAFAGLLLTGGTLGDRLGRRPVLLVGLVLFGAGSAGSAFSGSVAVLVGARAVMGVGGALVMPSTLSLITAIFREDDERTRAIGVWSGTSGLGVALGPLVGGVLLAHFWWGSVFLVNVPVAVLGVVLALRYVPNSRDPESRPPDPVGAVLSTSGLGMLLWAVIEAPSRGWSSPAVLGGVVAGVAVLAAFARYESRSRHPMLRLEFFRSARFSVATGSLGMVMFGLFGALFVLTQLLQFALGFTPIQAGVRVLPVAGLLAVTAPLAGRMVRRVGTKLPVTVGLLVVAGGLAQLSSLSATDPTFTAVLPGMLALGVGAGLTLPPAVDSVMGSVPVRLAGIGSATNGVSLQTGGALGVAVLGSALNARYQQHILAAIAGHPVPAVAQHAILGSIGGAMSVAGAVGGPTGAALASAARSAFVEGMDLAMLIAAAVALAAALFAARLLPARPAPSGRA